MHNKLLIALCTIAVVASVPFAFGGAPGPAPTATPQTAAPPKPSAGKGIMGVDVPQGKGKLRVGIYAYMTQGIDFKRLVKKYTNTYPAVEIQVIEIPGEESAWQAITQKMQLAAQQKRADWDIVIGPTPFVEPGAMAPLGLLTPIDDLLPRDVFEDMYTGVREEIKWTGNGKSYLVPWWSDVFGLIYRPSMLKEAVGTDKAPETWDEILQYAEKIKAKYGNKIAAFGADWTFGHRMFIPMLNTLSEKPFTDDGVLNLDDPAARKTLEYMMKLYPYMPATAQQSLGSSKAFQSGGLAMEIYWQPQLLRAIQAKQPIEDMKMVAFPKGTKTGTIFWTAGAIIPTHSTNKGAALHFVVKGMYDYEAVHDSNVNNWKITPFKSAMNGLKDKGALPTWASGLLPALDAAKPIPCNAYYLNVEQTAMQEELEKMFLKGQSIDATLANMKKRIADGVAEMKKK